ncbi:hypothetical protein [Haladaptatus caseinilyticus]|uniref:hypothetical protein n=1 Tax=Haladaptatus caseinilyticus TaxID=2993314 RepID=UPI00224B4037|nr:hypothetical protein [Haladaptatus caseinilyticus]
MSTEKPREEVRPNSPTCPWCAKNIDEPTDRVQIVPPTRQPPERRFSTRSSAHTWHLHRECASQWRNFVSHLRTLSGCGAFRTLVEGPLSGDVNEMVEWNDS